MKLPVQCKWELTRDGALLVAKAGFTLAAYNDQAVSGAVMVSLAADDCSLKFYRECKSVEGAKWLIARVLGGYVRDRRRK